MKVRSNPIELIPCSSTTVRWRRSGDGGVVHAGRPRYGGGEYPALLALDGEGVRAVGQHIAGRLALVLGELKLVRHGRSGVGQVG